MKLAILTTITAFAITAAANACPLPGDAKYAQADDQPTRQVTTTTHTHTHSCTPRIYWLPVSCH
jgi:hypothetical protein